MKKVLILLMTVSLFMSCDSDSTSNENNLANGAKIGSTFDSMREKALIEMNQGGTIHYSPDQGAVYKLRNGTTIHIPPHSIVTKDGSQIDGPITIDYIEIFRKEQMAIANTPTMGQVPDSEQKDLLVSGGEFYIDIKFNGEQVEIIAPVKVNIATSNSEADPNGMNLWNGETDNNTNNFTWNLADPNDLIFEGSGPVFGGEGGAGGFYDVLIKNSTSLGWCNIDKFAQFPDPKTRIRIIVPNGFDQTNSSVYLAVRNQPNMLARFDMFYPSSNVFEEHYGLVPVGLDCHLIFVGEQNGQYVYSILSTAIGNNATYSIPSGSLITASSYHQVENAISILP